MNQQAAMDGLVKVLTRILEDAPSIMQDQRDFLEAIYKDLSYGMPPHRVAGYIHADILDDEHSNETEKWETIWKQANAAISAVEKLTHPQDQLLVFDLDKAERVGEKMLRDSPIVSGAVEGLE